MIPRSTPRTPWAELPEELRGAIEQILGGAVVTAVSQPGGFSPGSADRVITAGGRRAFVKTAHSSVNAESPGIHRREASIAAVLPAHVPAPRLLGSVDLGESVAVVSEDVEGRHPSIPWRPDELTSVLDALYELGADPVATELAAVLPALAEEMRSDFAGWARVIASGSAPAPLLGSETGAWALARLESFAQTADAALDDLRGDRLVHVDVRADNVLIRADGTVVLVDWPWAARGVGWFDALTLLINVRLYDPQHDVQAVVDSHPVLSAASPEAIDRVLTAIAGYFIDASLRPPAAGIPTLRGFQRDQGIATLDWLREREA